MADLMAVKCAYVRSGEYNGRPQLLFRLPETFQYAEFSVFYDPATYPAPTDNQVRWYAFAAGNYKFTCGARVYLGQMNENYFREG